MPVVGDTSAEADETFFVNVSNVVGATTLDGQAVGTIVDDDGAGGTTPLLSIASVQHPEGNLGSTPFIFTVTLSPAATKPVRVDYATADGTATAGEDYGPTSGQLTFKTGETAKQVTVFANGDTSPEPNETFLVNLSNPTNALLGVSQATGTIQNDDDQAPVGSPQSQTTLEDTPILLTLSASDAEGENLTFAVGTGPSHGSIGSPSAASCAGVPSTCTATVTYSPNADYNGSDGFTFTANDGFSDSAPAAVDLSITPVNDEPSFAKGADQTVVENSGAQSVAGWATSISAGATNESAQTLTFHVSNDNNALFSAQPDVSSNGTLTFTPASDALGSATVSIFLTDDGGTANGGDDTSPTQTFSIDVTLVNHAPSFDVPASPNQAPNEDAGAQTVAGFATNISKGPANESAQTLTFHVSNNLNSLFDVQPSIDTTTGNLTYTPAASGDGTATVSVFLTDSGGAANGGDDTSPTKTFTITVVPPNRPPTATDQSTSTNEDTLQTISLQGTDPDGDTLTFTITDPPDHGSLGSIGTPNCTGTPSTCTASVDYTPAPNYNGPDSFKFKTNDGSVDSAADGTISITVNAVDDPSIAVDDSGTTVLEDASATTINVRANDTDVDSAVELITAKTNGANGATVTITNGGADLTYLPAANFCGSDSFTYTLSGGDSATVAVTVTCVNDAPSFTKGANQGPVDNQNADGTAKAYTVNGWATAISKGPSNESGQTVDFVIDSVVPSNLFTVQPAVSAAGALTYTTDPAQSGTATVTLHIHDDGGTTNGGVNASATQSFTIQTVNPAPIAIDDAYTATGNVSINVNQTAEGVLQRGTDDTLFSATITNCGPTNAATTAVSGGGIWTTTSANGGNVVLTTSGQFTYNPPAGFLGADHFFYKLTNSGGNDVGDVTVTVGDMIWFFDASNASAGDGRLSSPFQQISSFVNDGTGNNGKDNQTLFISNGSYDDPLTLRSGQIVVGKGAGAAIVDVPGANHIVLAPFSVALPTTGGTRPSLSTASGSAITLGSGNTIRGLNVGNTAVSDIVGSSFGTLALSEVDLGGTGQALDLTTGTANATFGSVSSTSGTNGIKLSSVAGTLNFGSGGALSGASGAELLVSGGANTWTYPGTITKTAAGKTVDISSRTGGTITLSGAISGTGGVDDGASLSTNTGATISLTGGMALSTGANAAFAATGGGTVNVTGTTNTLTTTTGTALSVSNTTIGGLIFQSISSNGAATGIVLNSTGSSGGLTVTGNGGTCSSAATCTGGAIQNATSGISLTSTTSPSFDRMFIENTSDSGVKGSAVTNFSFTNGTINNSGVGAATGSPFSNIQFGSGTGNNIAGTLTVTGNTLTNAFFSGVAVNSDAGTVTDANISNNTITSSTSASSSEGSGIFLSGSGTAGTAFDITKAELNSNQITNFPGGSGILVEVGNPSGGAAANAGSFDKSNVIEIGNNTIAGASAANGMAAFGVVTTVTGGSGGTRCQGFFDVHDNTISNVLGEGIEVGANSNVDMRVINDSNTIHAHNINASQGIGGGNGSTLNLNSVTPHLIWGITNNTIDNTDGNGILAVGRATSGTLDLDVENNNVSTPTSSTTLARRTVEIEAGNTLSANDTIHLQIFGNTVGAGLNGAGAIGVRKQGSVPTVNVFGIFDAAGGPSLVDNPTNAQVQAFVGALNPGATGVDVLQGPGYLRDTTHTDP